MHMPATPALLQSSAVLLYQMNVNYFENSSFGGRNRLMRCILPGSASCIAAIPAIAFAVQATSGSIAIRAICESFSTRHTHKHTHANEHATHSHLASRLLFPVSCRQIDPAPSGPSPPDDHRARIGSRSKYLEESWEKGISMPLAYDFRCRDPLTRCFACATTAANDQRVTTWAYLLSPFRSLLAPVCGR